MKINLCCVIILSITLMIVPQSTLAETVYSCVHKTNGKVRIVSAPGQCHENSENELSWVSSTDLEQTVNSMLGRITAIESAVGMFNESPTVDAGSDQSTLLSLPVYFEALASDDGILNPLTFNWEKTNGPGEAQFSDSYSAATEVSFTDVGIYDLSVTVDDGYVEVSDSVTITVYPDNDPPSVDAGEDRIDDASVINRGGNPYQGCYTYIRACGYYLDAIVQDDGLPSPYTVNWSFDRTSLNTYPPYGGTVVALGWNISDNSSPATWFQDFGIRFPSSCATGPSDAIQAFSTDLTISVNDGYHTTTETVRVYCTSPNYPNWEP